MLTQRCDIHVTEYGCVKCILSLVWRHSSVRSKTVKFYKQILNRYRIHSRQVGISGMNHHRRVNTRERALARHFNFSTAAFFGWRAH